MKPLIVCVILFVAADDIGADAPKASAELQSLSGILRKGIKSGFKHLLQLDGMTGRMNLSGDSLAKFEPGDRIMAKGVIKTRLLNPKPNRTPQQQPIHWVIFMEVQDAKKIKFPFGLKHKTVAPPPCVLAVPMHQEAKAYGDLGPSGRCFAGVTVSASHPFQHEYGRVFAVGRARHAIEPGRSARSGGSAARFVTRVRPDRTADLDTHGSETQRREENADNRYHRR